MVNIMIHWLVAGLLSVMHPFFLSVVQIDHNPREASLEISVRVFSDDLEKTLQQNSKSKIDIIHPADRKYVEQQLFQYMQQHIRITANGKPVSFQFVGYEQQLESTWSYFEIPNIKELNTLAIDCSLLHDFEKNQVNIIHVKSKGKEKSYKLDYPNRTTSFSF